MSERLKEHLIAYLESVLETPNMPPKASKELSDGITLLKKANHIIFPYVNDSSLDTIVLLRKMMDTFFEKYPSMMATKEKIDLQELNLQRFIQNTGLLKPKKTLSK